MENEEKRIETPEIDQINEMMSKIVGGYQLMSKAFMAQQISELKERIDKAGYEYGRIRARVGELENRPTMEQVKTLINAAKTELRGEISK